MKFSVTRENLLEPLQLVTGVVERRQTLPILSNLLVEPGTTGLSLTGTDQEVELIASVADVSGEGGEAMTIPARKFLDICRSLPASAEIEIKSEEGRLLLTSGRFRSHLASLAPDDFPKVRLGTQTAGVTLTGKDLCRLLDKCSFAMAQQDVRYFFNGVLLELESGRARTVATNGQRLASTWLDCDIRVSGKVQVIIPRKGVLELGRVVPANDEPVELQLSANHMRVATRMVVLTTRLIDATYPEYSRAIPDGGDKTLVGDRQEIKEALSRTAILSNEMYRNVRLLLSAGKLAIQANNPLQEEAEEIVAVDYDGDELDIGFNVSYLIDALGAMEGNKVRMRFSDAGSAALLTDINDQQSRFVVSPMML